MSNTESFKAICKLHLEAINDEETLSKLSNKLFVIARYERIRNTEEGEELRHKLVKQIVESEDDKEAEKLTEQLKQLEGNVL